jgi:hypothetical protein
MQNFIFLSLSQTNLNQNKATVGRNNSLLLFKDKNFEKLSKMNQIVEKN